MEWYLKVIKNYAKFSGRARRKEYWMFILINAIIGIVLMIMDTAFGLNYSYSEYGSSGLISSVYNIFIFIPSLAVTVRRFHDVNKSGWLIGMMYIVLFVIAIMAGALIATDSNMGMFMIIPILGLLGYGIYLFVLTVTEGDQGSNQYGENPKANGESISETVYTS